MNVYVDGVMATSWTSSGTTTDFENVDLGVTGQAVELRGVLADSEWFSITEVRARCMMMSLCLARSGLGSKFSSGSIE